jgi:uncharacterized membrane protein YgaE (UPF0421/DUF939 family)
MAHDSGGLASPPSTTPARKDVGRDPHFCWRQMAWRAGPARYGKSVAWKTMASRILLGMTRETILDTLRTAFACVLSLMLARLLKMPEYYWAPISTIVIVQTTMSPLTVGWQRFLGTAVGAVLGAALATYFPPNAAVYGLGVLACGVVAWLLRVGGSFKFAGITLSIILLIPQKVAPWVAGWHRFLEVSLGIAVGLVVMTVWPQTKKEVE